MAIDSGNIPEGFNSLNNNPETNANNKFAIGPAAATFIMSVLEFRKSRLSTGTGLAQPNPTKRIIIEPIISKCAKGFIVNLPIRAALLSPHLNAIHAWANS